MLLHIYLGPFRIMTECKCPICPETFTIAKLTFVHLLWKHPMEYLKLKHSTKTTKDEITLMCQKFKKNDVVKKGKIKTLHLPRTSTSKATTKVIEPSKNREVEPQNLKLKKVNDFF